MNHKKEFPIFQKNPKLIYLDSAATTQKPKVVIDAINKFYKEFNANINRGLYDLSIKSTEAYESAREKIANFINADKHEIIFTSGTTDSLNKLSRALPKLFNKRNEIVLTEMEHHSNLVPWQETAKENKMKLKFIPLKNMELDYEIAEKIINDKTAIVSLTYLSNSLGTINNIEKIIELAKKHGAIVIIDAAQSIAHKKIDVKKLNADFLVFSGHKMFASTGIGIIYGKKQILEKLPAFQFGGDMIKEVSLEESSYELPPKKFEAGTPNIAGAISLGKAIDYINNIGINKIEKYENELTTYTIKELKKIPKIIIYESENQGPIISFNLDNIHPHDIASILSYENIAIRAGHHCCMPLMKKLEVQGTCRISLSIYNNKEDIDKLIQGIKKVKEVFK